jgi:hypothetical protein
MTKEQIIEIMKINLQLDMPNPEEAEGLVADAILALDEQSEESYPKEFVEWYSGMEFIKIDSAFKRWKRETGNQK